jgi:hypothetical protein
MKSIKLQFDSFIKDVDYRTELTYQYFEKYSSKNYDLKDSIEFIEHLIQAISSKNRPGIAGKLFSAVDARLELINSLNVASICLYKSSIDSLRRAFEIIFIACFFDLKNNNEKEVFKWLESNKRTPSFSNTIDELFKIGNFKKFNDIVKWDIEVKQFYWELSGYTHTKGISKSIYSVNSTKSFNNTPEFNEESLNNIIELFVKVISFIAINFSLANPILLTGLPVFRKYGVNARLGIFESNQSDLLNKILPNSYRKVICEIVSSDVELQQEIKRIRELPDAPSSKKIIDSMKK